MNDWKKHTRDNPFWKSTKPVDVKFFTGVVKRFGCPKCAKGSDKFVVEWRESEK